MNWLKQLFPSKKCYICGQKATKPQTYVTDQGESVRVCYKCVPYAERRALRKP
ncbi:hypothetical protein BN1058_00256 [Paraliobacillus sp. PM-2]|uniref:hypothetical protein n=1 Tax=Paraliobacillus sp. PM-2 TaxID=1462524 RepID=UPI00061CBDEA|nr:hypothetical protein [Paraliobacillus sp. PM-2]CQR46013.1 hypothetical protein BN1058_00256 [Paraliobacillus sp. PM-2]